MHATKLRAGNAFRGFVLHRETTCSRIAQPTPEKAVGAGGCLRTLKVRKQIVRPHCVLTEPSPQDVSQKRPPASNLVSNRKAEIRFPITALDSGDAHMFRRHCELLWSFPCRVFLHLMNCLSMVGSLGEVGRENSAKRRKHTESKKDTNTALTQK